MSKLIASLSKGEVDRNAAEAQDRFIPGLASATKGVDVAERVVDGIASTIHIDRDGEIILPSAFAARMDKFMGSNAPFAAAHTHRSQSGAPTQIGWVMEMAIEADRVPCKFRFATTSVAEDWWKLASDPKGKGIAFSIGFYPIRFVYGSAGDLVKQFPELRKPLKDAGVDDEDKLRVYTEIELLEISGVMAPSNRESLQMLAAKMLGLPDPEAAGEEALAALVERISDAVLEKMSAGTTVEPATLEMQRDTATDDLKAFFVEQIDELKALLPDTINLAPDADGPTGDATDEDEAAAGDDVGQSLEAHLAAIRSIVAGGAQ